MKSLSRTVLVMLLVCGILSTVFISAHAADRNTTQDPRILTAVSDMGIHTDLPENSMASLQEAILSGVDMIRIPVKKTADGNYILSQDDTLERMCGSPAVPIDEMTMQQIRELSLFKATGGNTEKTTEPVAELSAVLRTFGNKSKFLIDMDWQLRDEIYDHIKSLGKLDCCILICRTDAKAALAWKNELDTPIQIMVYKKTNIIFSAWAQIAALKKDPDAYLWLATSNPYGVIFQKAVTNQFSSLAGVMVLCSEPELCGKRTDTKVYWDDLVSRSYNMICTDHAASMLNYIADSETARQALQKKTDRVLSEWSLPVFSGVAFADYKFAYNNAVTEAKRLSAKNFAGQAECEAAEYALDAAIQTINENYKALSEGKAGLTLTPGRIATAVIAAAAFIALELFFHKHRGKNKKNI